MLEFFRALALCNTVVPSTARIGPVDKNSAAVKNLKKSLTSLRDIDADKALRRLEGSVADHRKGASESTHGRRKSVDVSSLHTSRRKSFLVPKDARRSSLTLFNLVEVNEIVDKGAIITFKGSSPDEEALVEGSASLGVTLRYRKGDKITIEFVDLMKGEDKIRGSFDATQSVESLTKIHPPHSRRQSLQTGMSQQALFTVENKLASINEIHFPGQHGHLAGSDHNSFITENYQLLHVLPFTSERKRMSVIVRELEDPNLIPEKDEGPAYKRRLYTKGADDVMLPICNIPKSLSELENIKSIDDRDTISKTLTNLELFSKLGLRTLIVASRTISPQEYEQWSTIFQAASTSLNDRETLLANSYEKIEKNMTLLGVSAVEDKLQDKVPETIEILRKMGCRVWMLTGDKRSTAMQIGLTCGLISSSQESQNLVSLDHHGKPSTQFYEELASHYIQQLEKYHSSHQQAPLTIVIDGETLNQINEKLKLSVPVNDPYVKFFKFYGLLPERDSFKPANAKDADIQDLFLDLCIMAKTVICCRVTPSQKQRMVRMVKERKYNTLAIGDGGNDVAMIQEANVGIGIRGKEGFQAARAADYSIGQFRFLQRLLLVHGRDGYLRSCYTAKYCFYKSFFLVCLQLIYQVFNRFVGGSLFNSFMLTTFNTVFTSIPMFAHFLDRDLKESSVINSPEIYRDCVKGTTFTMYSLFQRLFLAFVQALILIYFVYSIYGGWFTSADSFASTYDTVMPSTAVFCVAVYLQTIQVAFDTQNFTIINLVAVVGNIVIYMVLTCLGSLIFALGVTHFITDEYVSLPFWLLMIISTVTAMLPSVLWKYCRLNYFPENFEKIQILQKSMAAPKPPTRVSSIHGDQKLRFNEAHFSEKTENILSPTLLQSNV